MKKILINASLAIGLLAALGACKDKLEELYADPAKTDRPSIEKFFTRMLDNDRVRPNYWEIRTFALVHTAKYTQSATFINGSKAYQQQISYLNDRWNDYYTPGDNGGGIIAQYREIEKAYAALPEADKANAEVLVQAAKVILMDQTAQMVDLWGDIPFSEAGGLNLTNKIVYPKFDDAKTVYDAALNGLKEASDYFASTQLGPVAKTTFQKQDILLGGDPDKWRRYANSIRLRLLMRISFVDEARARTEVAAMLGAPEMYPLVDEAKYDILLEPLDDYTDDLHNALGEVSGQFVPASILAVMKPAGELQDPRVPVMFDKNVRSENGVSTPNEDYFGMPSTASAAEQEDKASKNQYAVLDSATFIQNKALPGIVITSAEVNFLKAEAYERWGGGEAAKAYQTGIRQSVDFYYNLNRMSSFEERDPLTTPTNAEIDVFLATSPVLYAGSQEEKLGKIWTQKWLHFGLLQSVQNWAEVRRTGYPKLTFQQDASTPTESLPPSRLIYPATEKSLNGNNYAQVAGKDTPTTKIFWDVK
jgi:hypothetical protein